MLRQPPDVLEQAISIKPLHRFHDGGVQGATLFLKHGP
jgi:hypothetical protein